MYDCTILEELRLFILILFVCGLVFFTENLLGKVYFWLCTVELAFCLYVRSGVMDTCLKVGLVVCFRFLQCLSIVHSVFGSVSCTSNGLGRGLGSPPPCASLPPVPLVPPLTFSMGFRGLPSHLTLTISVLRTLISCSKRARRTVFSRSFVSWGLSCSVVAVSCRL